MRRWVCPYQVINFRSELFDDLFVRGREHEGYSVHAGVWGDVGEILDVASYAYVRGAD